VRAKGTVGALLAALGTVESLGAGRADGHAVLPALLELAACRRTDVEAPRAGRQRLVTAEAREGPGVGAGRAARVVGRYRAGPADGAAVQQECHRQIPDEVAP